VTGLHVQRSIEIKSYQRSVLKMWTIKHNDTTNQGSHSPGKSGN